MTAPRRSGAGYASVLPPHPLICGLAVGVPGGNLAAASQASAYSLSQPPIPAASPPPTWSAGWTTALTAFPSPQRAQVVVFAGYLGPPQTDPYPDGNNTTWRLLYQDAKAMSWLIVPESAIVLHDRARDDKAAFGLRDYIWVRADAPVRQGTEEESEQARFLVGTFTSAGDLHESLLDASTAPAGSGILCAPTPECCHRGTG